MSISNEGDPIQAHVRGHLFEPYFRVGGSGEKQGLGHGLFICSEIARSNGGGFGLECSAGKTNNVFRLPVKAAEQGGS